MIWNPRYECMDREELRALQLERLKETLAKAKRVIDNRPKNGN